MSKLPAGTLWHGDTETKSGTRALGIFTVHLLCMASPRKSVCVVDSQTLLSSQRDAFTSGVRIISKMPLVLACRQ